nr:uncharacterized protein LOC109168353 [Ipomoea batatas]
MADVNAYTGSTEGQTISSSRTMTELSSPHPLPAPNMLHQAHHYVSIKLTATNFLFWKAYLVPFFFLRGQNLYEFVDGTNSCPSETDAAYAQWIQQDQSILSMLISSMAEDVLYLAIGHATSRSVWLVVETVLGSTSRSRSLSLLSQLQNLQQGDASLTDISDTLKFWLSS